MLTESSTSAGPEIQVLAQYAIQDPLRTIPLLVSYWGHYPIDLYRSGLPSYTLQVVAELSVEESDSGKRAQPNGAREPQLCDTTVAATG